MTAQRPIDPRAAQLAGHAKPIVWASFESPSRAVEQTVGATQNRSLELRSTETEIAPIIAMDNRAASNRDSNNQLRSIVNSAAESTAMPQPVQAASGIQRLPESRLLPTRDDSPSVPRTHRDASGWKASR